MHETTTFYMSTLSAAIVFIVLLFQIARIPLFKEVRDELRLIRLAFQTIEARVGKLEEWAKGHERLDDEMHTEVNRRLGTLDRLTGLAERRENRMATE